MKYFAAALMSAYSVAISLGDEPNVEPVEHIHHNRGHIETYTPVIADAVETQVVTKTRQVYKDVPVTITETGVRDEVVVVGQETTFELIGTASHAVYTKWPKETPREKEVWEPEIHTFTKTELVREDFERTRPAFRDTYERRTRAKTRVAYRDVEVRKTRVTYKQEFMPRMGVRRRTRSFENTRQEPARRTRPAIRIEMVSDYERKIRQVPV